MTAAMKALLEKYEPKKKELDAILASESPTEEQLGAAKSLNAELAAMDEQFATLKAAEEAQKARTENLTAAPAATIVVPDTGADATKTASDGPTIKVIPVHGPITLFSGENDRERAIKAMRFGHFILGHVCGRPNSLKFCQEYAIKAHSEGSNTGGGVLVPDEFAQDVINNVDTYGVFRGNAKRRTMTRDTLIVPRRTSGVTAYFVGEASGATESTKGWDNVSLTAKKLAALTLHSSELAEDAVIDVAQDLMDEIAMAFAEKEDRCGFLGDGSSTYGGMLGLQEAIKKQVTDLGGTWTTDAHKLYAAGVVNAAGNAWSEITAANMSAVKGRVAAWAYKKARAGQGACKWYCSQAFYSEVIERLVLAAGGTQAAEMVAGYAQPKFLGFAVETSEVLPQSESNSTIPCYFGNLALAASFGDLRELTLAKSDQYKFAEDQLAIRGTERFDIVVHDIGTGSTTRTSQVLGPIGCLALLNA